MEDRPLTKEEEAVAEELEKSLCKTCGGLECTCDESYENYKDKMDNPLILDSSNIPEGYDNEGSIL